MVQEGLWPAYYITFHQVILAAVLLIHRNITVLVYSRYYYVSISFIQTIVLLSQLVGFCCILYGSSALLDPLAFHSTCKNSLQDEACL